MPPIFSSRVVLTAPPFADFAVTNASSPWTETPQWPARWISLLHPPQPPFVAAYRLDFELLEKFQFRAHVTGDERYELFLDAERIGRGPARAPRGWWHFESFDFEIPAGKHSLVARVWSLGDLAPWAQTTFRHGFLFTPENEALWDVVATGRANWRGKKLPGYGFIAPQTQSGALIGIGASFDIQGADFDWNWLHADAQSWDTTKAGASGNSGFTLYVKDLSLIHI